ncbi:MAG TPA: NAD(P)H-dependent glycerol-3-phosphate dehydrogenase [Spirochaetota bacterium]|nr:NAD(P)H-dependent glycerol-3-phosphate dehydrogenase [Spirochaetota bacterium]HPJ35416.1 NAD(P)H-dependent glycerol-3-phosphate dehydrogenase [Spirochaetota bacterium]
MPERYGKIKQITIIGAGSWGTAVAKVIAENKPGLLVKMWAYEKSVAQSINNRNINNDFLPGVKLPDNIKATNHLRESLSNASGIIIATPSKVVPDTANKIGKFITENIPIAYLSKGFCRYNDNILTISQTIGEILPEYKKRIVGIYGPSHAEEVVKYYHTCLAVASMSEADRKFFLALLNCDYLQCRETEDVLGVDLGGTLKNPAAIAAGMIDMLPRCGDNLEGALIAESLKEMNRLASSLGADFNTIIDITGTGDLVATALSEHSRNRRFGRDIAKKILEKGTTLSLTDKIYLRFKPEYVLEKISSSFHYLAEGAYAIEPLIELAERKSVAIPVYRSLYEVLLNKKEPSLLIETIKNPEQFEEIYNNAKLHVKDKKRGLENLKGKAFKKIIIQSVIDKFEKDYNTPDLKNFIISNLKDAIGKQSSSKKSFIRHEIKYISTINTANFDKQLKKLTSIYLSEIIDHNTVFINRLLMKYIFAKKIWKRLNGNKNRIKITGDTDKIRNLKERVNTIYISRYKNNRDFYYYIYAIHRKYLSEPRFYVPDEAAGGRLNRFLLKRAGGYIINNSIFGNLLYRECVIQYISTLIGHGVPLLYFPENYPEKNSIISSMDEHFFQLINDVMYQESTEIALIPLQLTYNDKLNESEGSSPLSDSADISFSEPLFLSDFTRQIYADTSVADMIKESWLSDEIILPHHIICGILQLKNNIIKAGKLKKYIERFISENSLYIPYNSRQIINKGLKFLYKNDIVQKKDEYIAGVKFDEINRYSEIIKRKKIESQ